MLSLFPIHFLAPAAYALLRIATGILLVRLGIRHIHAREQLIPIFTLRIFPYGRFFVWYLGIVEILIGTLLTIGLFTQGAALLLSLLALKFVVMHKKFKHPLIPERKWYILLAAIGLSLCVTGAGIFAFDLPI